ncbi:MAG: hypothetical protein GY696_20805, partial [Gammaproteobacteria bacterium]|nr:hypothetical protein [Gammaproteobacteria bacterium]
MVQDFLGKVLQEIRQDVADDSKFGPFSAPPFNEFVCSPVAAIPKGDDGKIRLIHNLSAPRGQSINEAIPEECYRTSYDKFDLAVAMVRRVGPGAWMVKIDLKSAFKHIVVRPDQWHLLGMHLDNEEGERGLYFDATLPFGLRSSPRIFNEFTKAIRYLAKQEEVIEDLFGYLDDFLLVGDTQQSCADKLRRLKAMAIRYGWSLKEEKERGPAQVIELLGIEIDALQQILWITEKRLMDTLNVLESWSFKKVATRREIASSVGKLNFVALVCRPGRAFLRRAIEVLTSPGGWDAKVRLDRGLLADVDWWRTFLPQWNGTSTFPDEHWFNSPDISLKTDTCKHGFGASYSGRWLYGEFSGWFYKQSMPFKEFFAIVAAVATWGHLWKGKKIKFFTDSWTVYQCIQLRRVHTPAMAALFRLLHWYSAHFDCFVGAAHIPGIENSEADAISRADFPRFFKLCPHASPSASPVPELFNSIFFSELKTSAAGRDCLKFDGSRSSPLHSETLSACAPTVSGTDAKTGTRGEAPGAGEIQGQFTPICGGAPEPGGIPGIGSILRGRGPPLCPDYHSTGRSEAASCRPTGVPPALQAAPKTEETNYDGYSGKDDGQSESSAHGEGNLGSDRGRSFRTLQIGGVGSKSPIGLQ